MSKKKKHKKSDKNKSLEILVFITAILNLVYSVLELLKNLLN